MCRYCPADNGYCFCGTNKDPQGRNAPCEVTTSSDGYCNACGHVAGEVVAEVPYDVEEYTA